MHLKWISYWFLFVRITLCSVFNTHNCQDFDLIDVWKLAIINMEHAFLCCFPCGKSEVAEDFPHLDSKVNSPTTNFSFNVYENLKQQLLKKKHVIRNVKIPNIRDVIVSDTILYEVIWDLKTFHIKLKMKSNSWQVTYNYMSPIWAFNNCSN